MQKKREQHEDAAQKLKNHAIKSLMGPRKSLGARGRVPCFPPPPPPPLLSVGLLIHTCLKCYNLFTAPTLPPVS